MMRAERQRKKKLKVSSQTRFAQHICFNIKREEKNFFKMMDKNI